MCETVYTDRKEEFVRVLGVGDGGKERGGFLPVSTCDNKFHTMRIMIFMLCHELVDSSSRADVTNILIHAISEMPSNFLIRIISQISSSQAAKIKPENRYYIYYSKMTKNTILRKICCVWFTCWTDSLKVCHSDCRVSELLAY